MILSIRKDGFGQRVKSLMYAMRFSKSIGHDYQFLWEEKTGSYGALHACKNANDIFEKAYYEKYFVDNLPEKYTPLNSALKREDILYKNNFYTVNGVSEKEVFDACAYKSEFLEIGFNEDIKKSIKFAFSIDVNPETKAIHLRGGDICYGPLKGKSILFQDKVITIPLAKKIIEDSKTDIIVFSQDPDFNLFLNQYDNVIFASDLKKESMQEGVSSVIFDVVLMSRCQEIYAGTSAIPELAAMISGTKLSTALDAYHCQFIVDYLDELVFKDDFKYNKDLEFYFLINLFYYSAIISDVVRMRKISGRMLVVNPENPQSILFGYFFNKEMTEKILKENYFKIKKIMFW